MKTFSEMPPHSRVWIYQSGRELTSTEVSEIKLSADEFVDQWSSHGKLMDACVEVFHNLFVVVCVDEHSAPASGCGIDKSVRFIQDTEKKYGLSLLVRTNIAFRNGAKTEIGGTSRSHSIVSETSSVWLATDRW